MNTANQGSAAENAAPISNALNRVGGASALIAAAFAILKIIIETIGTAFTPNAIFILEAAGLFYVLRVVLVGRRLSQIG